MATTPKTISSPRSVAELSDRFDQFVRRIHASLDPQTVAFALANEGRMLVDCDRLSVVQLRAGQPRLLAVSGIDTPDRRGNFVQCLEELVRRVLSSREPLWFDGHAPLSPQIESALQPLLDVSHARVLAVLPLCVDDRTGEAAGPVAGRLVVGAIVVERFTANPPDEAFRRRADAVAEHGALALHNARTYHRVPLLPLWRMLDRLTWLVRAPQLPWTVLALVALVCVIAALALIPADFEVLAHGQLQPQIRREVFASGDGQVIEVRTAHGQAVRAGQVLAVLRRPQLDLDFSRLLGEIETARKRLAAVQAARLEGDGTRNDSPQKMQQFAAEEEELKSQLESLAQQKKLLDAERAELELTSPIDGEVLTWNVEPLLQQRPVQRGQSLLTVADVHGPWVLEVRLDDDRIGSVLAAQQAANSPLAVNYVLATDPAAVHRGTLQKLAQTAETDRSGTWVSATVAIDHADLADARPGAATAARIHCGRRAIGYVWFHELWQAIEARLF